MIVKLIRRYRRHAYKSAKVAGDVQAVLQGRFVDRYVQRKAGALSRQGLNKLRIGRKRR